VLFYLAWWVLHSVWLLTVGVDCPGRGQDTVFGNLYEKHRLGPLFSKKTGLRGIRSHAAIYLALHCFLTLVWAYPWAAICKLSGGLHLAFGALLFVSAAWYGAGYYEYIIVRKYPKALHKIIEKGKQS